MRSRALAAAVLAAVVLTATAVAAAAKPDAHDRALIAQLNAKAKTFRSITSGTSSSQSTALKRCAAFQKDPSEAFSAFFLLIPVFLTEVVNDYGSQITALRDTVAAMHPDSPVLARWLTAEVGSLDLLLAFDNHGKKVDLCAAANVLLDKKSTDADIFRVTGLHGTVIAQLFSNGASESLQKLNPTIRTFFVAAGLSAADAKILTTS